MKRSRNHSPRWKDEASTEPRAQPSWVPHPPSPKPSRRLAGSDVLQAAVRLYDRGIEGDAGVAAEVGQYALVGPGAAVRAVRGKGGRDVGDVHDPEQRRQPVSLQAVGVAAAVQPLVMPADELQRFR